ncbi:MAG: TIGR01777 family oxidoreductase [Propionibacteriaceae bacterium]|jgi:uncharacterized protein (TIGR01777 family)|nr:TIGR01777 family oxidoreductase [Propionibacteriaceae bacterium]
MRVAVSGSSGLLGSSLVPALLREGHEVVRLVRRPAQGPDERSWDPGAGRIDGPALSDVDAVVNFSGSRVWGTPWNKSSKQELVRSRVSSTFTIVANLTRDGRCQRLLNASAMNYYGDPGLEIVDEGSPMGDGFLAELTRDWENAARLSPVPCALMRTGQVLTENGGYLSRMKPLFNLYLGGRIGNGRQFLSWISLTDQVRATMFLLKSAITGPVNICSPFPVSNADFTRAIGAHLHRPTMVPLPVPVVEAILGREYVDETILHSVRARPAVLLGAGFEFRHPKLRAALAAIKQAAQ